MLLGGKRLSPVEYASLIIKATDISSFGPPFLREHTSHKIIRYTIFFNKAGCKASKISCIHKHRWTVHEGPKK
jgi:hypothetical protein